MSSSSSTTTRALRATSTVSYRETKLARRPRKKRRTAPVPWDAPCNLVDAIIDAEVHNGVSKLCVRFNDGNVSWEPLDTIEGARAEMFQGWISTMHEADECIGELHEDLNKVRVEREDLRGKVNSIRDAAERAINANRTQAKRIGKLQAQVVREQKLRSARERSYLLSLAKNEKLERLLELEVTHTHTSFSYTHTLFYLIESQERALCYQSPHPPRLRATKCWPSAPAPTQCDLGCV